MLEEKEGVLSATDVAAYYTCRHIEMIDDTSPLPLFTGGKLLPDDPKLVALMINSVCKTDYTEDDISMALQIMDDLPTEARRAMDAIVLAGSDITVGTTYMYKEPIFFDGAEDDDSELDEEDLIINGERTETVKFNQNELRFENIETGVHEWITSK